MAGFSFPILQNLPNFLSVLLTGDWLSGSYSSSRLPFQGQISTDPHPLPVRVGAHYHKSLDAYFLVWRK